MKRTTHFNEVEANDFKVGGVSLVPITEDITYTVAADGDPAGVNDFDSIDEAMWALTKIDTTKFMATLSFQDGEHTFHSDTYTHVFVNSNIALKSTSADNSLCTINKVGVYFIQANSSNVTIANLKIDGGLIAGTSLLISSNGCRIRITNILATNWPTTYQLSSSNISFLGDNSITEILGVHGMAFSGSTVGSISSGSLVINSTAGTNRSCIWLADGSELSLRNMSLDMSGSSTGVTVSSNSRLTMQSDVTYTNTATIPTNIPLREIQYDNSLITDGTAALSFKA